MLCETMETALFHPVFFSFKFRSYLFFVPFLVLQAKIVFTFKFVYYSKFLIGVKVSFKMTGGRVT